MDGTANFINGFPLFCGSIGVVKDGVPIAGALWCASSHKLRAGSITASRAGR
ncbi:inositol monophosphatase family protein [Pseudoroseomonas wenyumeiae]